MERIRVVQFGIGEIGRVITAALLESGPFELVGAYDIDPDKVGKDLGELAGLHGRLGVVVTDDLDVALSEGADVVLHSTSSRLEEVIPQLGAVAERGVDVISSCEELSFPFRRHPTLAERVRSLAEEAGVTVLGTGVNPGFVMDFLPLALTLACRGIEEVRIRRVVNAATRRRAFQRKIGLGLAPEEFQELMRRGGGHVGLGESLDMVAAGLGWDVIEETVEIEPIIATEAVEAGGMEVGPGRVIGLRQSIRAEATSGRRISLDFIAGLSLEGPLDEIVIRGRPEVKLRIEGGLQGEEATAAVMVNLIPWVVEATSGLKTMLDLLPFRQGGERG